MKYLILAIICLSMVSCVRTHHWEHSGYPMDNWHNDIELELRMGL